VVAIYQASQAIYDVSQCPNFGCEYY
jgi:hypothetical protein